MATSKDIFALNVKTTRGKRLVKMEINLSEEDLQQLMNGEEFNWNFDGIDVHLFKGEEE